MTASRNPAFSNVLYVTSAKTDQWFIPTTGYGDNPNSGNMSQRLDQCKEMLSALTPLIVMHNSVKQFRLAAWTIGPD